MCVGMGCWNENDGNGNDFMGMGWNGNKKSFPRTSNMDMIIECCVS